MVTKVVIRDNAKSPLRYLQDIDNFKNGTKYVFKPGVNVIVGENGCGKTTLMNLIRKYLCVDYTECSRGIYNCNINELFVHLKSDVMLDGVDVYADYTKNTFRLSHAGEKQQSDALTTFEEFGSFFEQNSSSTGEGVIVAINYLFGYIFGRKASLKFDYHGQFEDLYPMYVDYVERHRVICDDEWTILMDEPDRNLSLDNILQINGILSFHKPNVQIIAVVHNPLLIYALSEEKDVNIIEMTDGYVKKVKRQIKELVR